ncbi:MAG: CPBP family intramembrane metalloprotease, partial [Myxococcales bacterium]
MRPSIVWVIVLKELREALRDRRTLMRLLVLPMLVYPLFAIGVSKFQKAETDEREARSSRVALWGSPPPGVAAALRARPQLEASDWTGAPDGLRAGWEQLELPAGGDVDSAEANAPSDHRNSVPVAWTEPDNPALAAARAALARREVDAIAAFWPAHERKVAAGERARVAIYFDPTRPESMLGRERVEWALRLERKRLQAEREGARGLPGGYSVPFEMVERTAAVEGRSGGRILGSMMPMLLILMSLLGGFMPAIDLTAGEKERGTMQTLMCAPLLPVEIILGKFVAVSCISLLTAVFNLLSVGLTMQRILPADLTVGLRVYVLSGLLLIPVNLLFSAMFLALAAFARDFKDGQNVLMPVYLPLTLLAGLASLPTIELDVATSLA